MKCYRPLTEFKRILKNRKGVALFIVLTSMATLAIFLGEITYTAQINQKLAYDRLDNVKATALAKSGFRLALLRIRAYAELKKTISGLADSAGAAASAVNSVVPKEMLEKIWSEPITVPFTGDISSLPGSARDAIEKFRKDSGMEGKVYISISSESSKFNLNSYLPSFSSKPSPTPKAPNSPPAAASPSPSPAAANASPSPSATPVGFDAEVARQMLTEQITQIFQRKFDEDEKFRDQYRNLKLSDIADEVMAWNDLTYSSMRTESTELPFKKAPFYDISELHYLPSVDDEIYALLAPSYSAAVESSINVNKILEPALMALVPEMTKDERKKFFEDRDQTGNSVTEKDPNDPNTKTQEGGGPFKSTDEFFEYLKSKVVAFNSPTKVQEFKDSLSKRGISIVIEETQFLIRIEATVHQTKKIMEGVVTLVPEATGTSSGISGIPGMTNPQGQPSIPQPDSASDPRKMSNLKVIRMRFL